MQKKETYYLVCFCAIWCDTCRQFKSKFKAFNNQKKINKKAKLNEPKLVWLDIDEYENILEELDLFLETFPTILIAKDNQVLFFGSILPNILIIEKLFNSLINNLNNNSNQENNEKNKKIQNAWQNILINLC